MKHVFLVGMVVCLIFAANSATVQAQSKTGAAKFTVGGNESYNVSLGNKVKCEATLQPGRLGSSISCKASINNTAPVKMYYSYNVAFLDKDKNVVGVHHFGLFIDGNKQGSAGTFVQLPPDQVARIAYYSVAFHESDKSIGSK